jgi:hypothetical protein
VSGPSLLALEALLEDVVPVKYSELSAIVYVFRPQVQVRLRGTLGAVFSMGALQGLLLQSCGETWRSASK